MEMSLDVMRKIWYNGWFPFVSWQIWWVRYDLTKIHTSLGDPIFVGAVSSAFTRCEVGRVLADVLLETKWEIMNESAAIPTRIVFK
jgi:hypothetical protein